MLPVPFFIIGQDALSPLQQLSLPLSAAAFESADLIGHESPLQQQHEAAAVSVDVEV